MTSIGITSVNSTSATAWPTSRRRTSELRRAKRMPAPNRSRHGSRSTCTSGRPRVSASVIAMARNDAASTSSAVATPNSAISRPASAAPPTEAIAKPMFISALPSFSSPAGWSMVATAPRVSPRPVMASEPSTSPSSSTSGSTNVAVGDQRERGEDDRLEHVQARQAAPQRDLVEPRGEGGSDERGQELGHDEERGRRRHVLRPVVDQHGERDDADRIAELVDRVRRQQATEGARRPEVQSAPARQES